MTEFLLWFTARPGKADNNLSLQEMQSWGFLPKGVMPHVIGAMVQLGENTASLHAGKASKITKVVVIIVRRNSSHSSS
jgi:hypothetical protein